MEFTLWKDYSLTLRRPFSVDNVEGQLYLIMLHNYSNEKPFLLVTLGLIVECGVLEYYNVQCH